MSGIPPVTPPPPEQPSPYPRVGVGSPQSFGSLQDFEAKLKAHKTISKAFGFAVLAGICSYAVQGAIGASAGKDPGVGAAVISLAMIAVVLAIDVCLAIWAGKAYAEAMGLNPTTCSIVAAVIIFVPCGAIIGAAVCQDNVAKKIRSTYQVRYSLFGGFKKKDIEEARQRLSGTPTNYQTAP